MPCRPREDWLVHVTDVETLAQLWVTQLSSIWEGCWALSWGGWRTGPDTWSVSTRGGLTTGVTQPARLP